MSTHNIGFYEDLTKMKKGNKQFLFDTPRTLMVNKEIISEYHNQRTIGPVNAQLISWPSKAQNLENIW